MPARQVHALCRAPWAVRQAATINASLCIKIGRKRDTNVADFRDGFKEIEIKHRLYNPQYVLSHLQMSGAVQIANAEFQEDTYYVPAHRNFLEQAIISEWLRIRRTADGAMTTYKRWLPVGAEIQTHCDEYEAVIAPVEAVERILEALDMRSIVCVRKKRSSWRLAHCEVAIDEVDQLGTFIELEFKGEYESVDHALASLQTVLQSLGAEVSLQDRRGYPYLLLERSR